MYIDRSVLALDDLGLGNTLFFSSSLDSLCISVLINLCAVFIDSVIQLHIDLSSVFSRALLKAKAKGIMIAWASKNRKNRKVNKKPNSIQKETFETQSSFSYNPWLSESR